MQFDANGHVVTITTSTKDGLMSEVAGRFLRGEGFALATVNLDHLVKLRDDESFRAAYDAQDLVVADGNPLVWMSRLAGDPIELIPGADMVVPLAQLAAQNDVPVGLVGSTEAALQDAARALCEAAPGLKVVSMISPPMGFDPSGSAADAIFDDLHTAGARLVFLALGAPKQEIMAARGRVATPQIGFASIGAGLDFLAGTQNRAPEWVRRLALEWMWRALSNPKRLLVRYLKCIAILPGHAWRSLRRRGQST